MVRGFYQASKGAKAETDLSVLDGLKLRVCR